jgi:hypothetical protein
VTGRVFTNAAGRAPTTTNYGPVWVRARTELWPGGHRLGKTTYGADRGRLAGRRVAGARVPGSFGVSQPWLWSVRWGAQQQSSMCPALSASRPSWTSRATTPSPAIGSAQQQEARPDRSGADVLHVFGAVGVAALRAKAPKQHRRRDGFDGAIEAEPGEGTPASDPGGADGDEAPRGRSRRR